MIIFSASPAPHDISQAADAGASGYLIKGGDLHDVAHAIQVVASGGTTWPARSRPHLVQPSHPDGGPDLTPADLQPHTDHPLPTR